MAIEIIDELRQKNDGSFPIVDANNIKGGYYQVSTVAERDAIPVSRMKKGMMCYCETGENGKKGVNYIYGDNGWEEAKLGGGGIETVEDQNELFALDELDRFEGMLAYVVTDGKTYQLVGGLTNEHWVPFSGGGGGAGGTVANLQCDLLHSSEGTFDAPSVPAPSDAPIEIPLNFTSPNIGKGVLHYTLTHDGETLEYEPIEIDQKPTTLVFDQIFEKSPQPYFVTLWVVDRAGQRSNTIYIRFEVALLEVTTTEKDGKVYYTSSSIRFAYTINNGLNGRPALTVEHYLAFDQQPYTLKETVRITETTQVLYYNIGMLSLPGVYRVKIVTMTEDGLTRANEIERQFIVSSPSIPMVFSSQTEYETATDTETRLEYQASMVGHDKLRVRGYAVSGAGEELNIFQGDVLTNLPQTWIIPAGLSVGVHRYRLYAQTIPSGGDYVDNELPLEFQVIVTEGNTVVTLPVTRGLFAEYKVDGSVTNNSAGFRERWQNSRNIENGPNIDFYNVAYSDNDGWQLDSGDMFFRLNGLGYAKMADYFPFKNDHDRPGGDEIKGWTFEIVCRSINVGNDSARIVGCTPAEGKLSGFYATPELASIATNKAQYTTLLEYERWTHITYVIHRDYREEDGEMIAFVFIYLDGVISRIGEISTVDATSFENANEILFNSEYRLDGVIHNQGACDIREIRIYDEPLTGDDVVTNYISTIKDPKLQAIEREKNERGAEIPVLKVNRRQIGVDNKGLPILEDFGDPRDKNRIHCTVEYKSLDDKYGEQLPPELGLYATSTIVYQGNSTLAYTKKNYKVRFRQYDNLLPGQEPPKNDDGYFDVDTDTGKYKYTPFPMGKQDIPDRSTYWFEEDTFTLKTDYMESTHASNPGSARYIHDMYRTGSKHRFVPPQDPRYAHIVGEDRQPFIRSTVDGYPIRLEMDGVNEGIHIMTIDKTSTDTFGLDPYEHEVDGEVVELFPLVQSYEIAANSDTGAGAFRMANLEEIHKQFRPRLEPPKAYSDNVEYSENLAGEMRDYTFDEDKWGATKNENGNEVWDSVEAAKADPVHLRRLIEWVMNTGNDYEAKHANYVAEYAKQDVLDLELASLKASGATNAEIAEKEQEVIAQRVVVSNAKATSDAVLAYFKATVLGEASTGFGRDYLDGDYLIDYYIFAMTFGMVDNFGKNAFFNTWDGRLWYISFYDMDSMLGVDNKGMRTRDVDIEVGDSDAAYGQHFNTSDSLLWVLVRHALNTEIEARYAELRNNDFISYETAYKYYVEDYIDRIPKIDYNRDAVTKYINIPKEDRATYLELAGGDRRVYLTRWIKLRIIFMDSFLNYTGRDADLANTIMMRAHLEKPGETFVDVRTTSPMYVKVTFQTGAVERVKCYPDRDTRITGIIDTAADQDVHISAAGYVKSVGDLSHFRVAQLHLQYAKRLMAIDVTASPYLQSFILGSMPYLRDVRCGSCDNLTGSLELGDCPNLMTLQCSSTRITGLTLPTSGSPLRSLDLRYCSLLENLTINRQANVTSIPLDGCTSLKRIELRDCPNLEAFEVPVAASGMTQIEMLTISDCPKIKALHIQNSTAMQKLTLDRNDALISLTLEDLRRKSSSPEDDDLQVELNVSKVPQLEYLSVTGCTIDSIRFHHATEEHPRALKTLILDGTAVTKIHYGMDAQKNDHMDLSGLQNLDEMRFNGCSVIEKITGLHYERTNAQNLFRDCLALKEIHGTLKLSGSCTDLFRKCEKLIRLPDVMDFSLVTDLTRVCQETDLLTLDDYVRVIESCWKHAPSQTSAVTDFSFAFSHNYLPSGWETKTAPSRLLDAAKFPKLTTTSYMFYVNRKLGGTLPGDLFGSSSATSAITHANHMFWSCGITGLSSTLMYPLKNLTTASLMFYWMPFLTGSIPSGFLSQNKKLTDAFCMFAKSSKLTGGIPSGLFNNLTELTRTEMMFCNCSGLTGSGDLALPDELFKHNLKLTNASAMFAGCTKLTGRLPGNLFGGYEDSYVHSLQTAAAMFTDTAITGQIPLELFYNCRNLTNVGDYYRVDPSHHYYSSEGKGMFAGTDLNLPLPLNDIDHSIFMNCGKLTDATGFLLGCRALPGDVPANFFGPCLSIQYMTNAFKDCTSLTLAAIPPLTRQRTKLISCAGLFQNVSGLTGELPEDLFEGCSQLVNASYMFSNCHLIGTGLPVGIFRGLTKLQNIAGMFQECRGIISPLPTPLYDVVYETIPDPNDPENSTIEISTLVLQEKGLFEDCPSLQDVSYLFDECRYITGGIPEHIFRKNPRLSKLHSCFKNCNGLEGSIPERLFELNREITDVSRLFYHCNNISGALPADLFKSCLGLAYAKETFAWCPLLTGYTSPDNILYLVDNSFFSRNSSLVDVEGLFLGSTGMEGLVPPNLLESKPRLTNLSKAFCYTKIHGALTRGFLRGSAAITNLYSAFERCTGLTSVSLDFLEPSATRVTSVRYAFLGCTSLSGDLPSFSAQAAADKRGVYAYLDTNRITNIEDFMTIGGSINMENFTIEGTSHYHYDPYLNDKEEWE